MMESARKKVQNARTRLQEFGLDDPRLLGLVLLAVIGLSVLWTGVGVVERNYELQQKVALIDEENRILELENSNKKIQNEYLKTTEFAELKARRVNGKALPGETVYTIDEDVAQKALKTQQEDTPATLTTANKSKQQENFEAWMRFFFGS